MQHVSLQAGYAAQALWQAYKELPVTCVHPSSMWICPEAGLGWVGFTDRAGLFVQ